MTQRRHLDDLFTAALDDELSPIDDARFYSHIHSCKDCAAAYAEFTATVEALRELPKARMARVVHLPSTSPVAEESARRRINMGWLNAGLLRRFPATALAGAAAVVLIVVALAHGGANTGSIASQSAGNGDKGTVVPAVGPGSNVTQDAACASQVTAVAQSSPPSNFSNPEVVSVPSIPGARLVLSASALSVSAGQNVSVYAQFSLPQVSAGAPGGTGLTTSTHSLRPCVKVTVGATSEYLGLTTAPAVFGNGTGSGSTVPTAESPAPGEPVPASSAPLFVFTVPAGTAPGSVLHVIASVPAGYEGFGSPALTATLTITIH